MDPLAAIDRALGRTGAAPGPLATGVAPAARDARLRSLLCFPDRQVPTGELAEWALALVELDKQLVVIVAIAAVEAARAQHPRGRDAGFADRVLREVRAWRDGPQTMADLDRLGDLWWRLVRNLPPDAQTPLGEAVFMTWWVAGYDPEGWGEPPTDPAKLERWLREAADNRRGIVDVLTLAQNVAGPTGTPAVIAAVRGAVDAWRTARP